MKMRWERAERAAGSHPESCPLGFALAAGFAISVIGCLLAALIAAPHQATARLVILALVIAGFAATVRNLLGSVLTAATAWSMYLGFLVGQTGELRWHGGVDLVRLTVLVGMACAGWARWPIAGVMPAGSAGHRLPRPRETPAAPISAAFTPGERAERARPARMAGARPARMAGARPPH